MSVLLFVLSAAPALAAGQGKSIDPGHATAVIAKLIGTMVVAVFATLVAVSVLPHLAARRHGDVLRTMGMALLVSLPVLAPATFLALVNGFWHKLG